MKNKIEAFLERKEIRDVFDIEFLSRRGVNFSVEYEELKKIKEIIQGWLGSNSVPFTIFNF